MLISVLWSQGLGMGSHLLGIGVYFGTVKWVTRSNLPGEGKVMIRHIICVPAKWTETEGESQFLRGNAIKIEDLCTSYV